MLFTNKIKLCRRNFIWLILIIIITTFSVIFLFKKYRIIPGENKPVSYYSKELEGLTKGFKENGSKKTVAAFQRKYAGSDPETVHNLEHLLGKLLYQNEGVAGLSLCPNSLLSGCYHGFFVEAFNHEGHDFLSKIDTLCQDRKDYFLTSGCIHGLGHGFLALEGNNQLTEALKNCGKVKYTIPYGDEMCQTGVFMEYNLVTEYAKEKETVRPRSFLNQKPYDPCLSLPSQFQKACFIQLPQWWGEVLKNDFEKMGNLCVGVLDSKNRESCFRSIGMVITRAANRSVKPEDNNLCSKMPTKEGVYFCLEESAKLLTVLKMPNPMKPCSLLNKQDEKNCESQISKFMCDQMNVCGKD